MNVSFKNGEELTNGFKITNKNGISEYVAQNENTIICFRTDSGEGVNYSQIQWITDKKTNRQYRAMRYLYKYVSLVQNFSNQLYTKYQEQ
jgi:hypothetical protein